MVAPIFLPFLFLFLTLCLKFVISFLIPLRILPAHLIHSLRKGPAEGREPNESPTLIILDPQAHSLGAGIHRTSVPWSSPVEWKKH